MNAELHEKTNHEKQVKYAAYLLTLKNSRRMGILEKMKPSFREKMSCLITDLKAKNISELEPQVRALYLSNLKRTNHVRYEELYPKIVAFIFNTTKTQEGLATC